MAKYWLLALTVFLAAGSIAAAQQGKSNQRLSGTTEVFVAAVGTSSQWIAPQADGPKRDGSFEKYGSTSTGLDLYWTAFVPTDGLRHPAVLVLHPGGFKTGNAGPAHVAN